MKRLYLAIFSLTGGVKILNKVKFIPKKGIITISQHMVKMWSILSAKMRILISNKFLQITQKEPLKQEMKIESELIFQKIFIWAFDENGKFSSKLNIRDLISDLEIPEEKIKSKDGFIESLNTVTYFKTGSLSQLLVLNNRVDSLIDSKESTIIYNNPQMKEYLSTISKLSNLKKK